MRHALRTLAKNPGFAAVAILAIALGVGPNSAVFSIIHTVLLQPLPIGNANRVVIVWETNKAHRSEQIAVSPQDLLDWQRESHAFVAFSPGNGSPEYGFNLTGAGNPERVLAGPEAVQQVAEIVLRSPAELRHRQVIDVNAVHLREQAPTAGVEQRRQA